MSSGQHQQEWPEDRARRIVRGAAGHRIYLLLLVPALVAAVTMALLPKGVSSADTTASAWTSSAKYGSWSTGGYTLYNDVWGSGTGPQTIWANSYSNWGVDSDQPATNGVKSYPNVSQSIGEAVSSLGNVTSSFSFSAPDSGDFEAAYDIWANDRADEIMLWTYTQNVAPLGTDQATASVGGSTWNIYRGNNGSTPVYSFVRTSNETSGSVDIKAVFNWLSSEGWLTGATLSYVGFGWEISSTNNTTEDFTVNSYSLST
jgi:Glycosyl hydrolase family 12